MYFRRFILILLFYYVDCQDKCVTILQKYGTCVNIEDCQSLVEPLKQLRSVPREYYEFLRKNQCGFDGFYPKVCCELKLQRQFNQKEQNCETPDRVPGKCINIRRCHTLFRLLTILPLRSRSLDFLKKSQCGYENSTPLVCCPTRPEIIISRPGFSKQPIDITDKPIMQEQEMNNYNIPNHSLLPEDCGKGITRKIIGGEVAELDEFPWMALLEYQTPQGIITACGGVLINNRYVLTAAHCLKNSHLPSTWKLISVRLGEYNIATPKDCLEVDGERVFCTDDPQSVLIEKAIAHENFLPESINKLNDIALLRLSREIKYTVYIQPICLPTSATLSGMGLFISGWGKTESMASSNVKLKVKIPVVDIEACSEKYRTVKLNLGKGQICAGGEAGKDSCNGDSGGPLMTVGNDNRWTAVGVVSFGPTPCGLLGWPGVYTKVYDFTSWILNNLEP